MKILVLNCGSSSIKYQFRNADGVVAKGIVERIGKEDAIFKYKSEKGDKKNITSIKNHTDGIGIIVEALTNKEYGCISDLKEIDAIGHRLVHGGEKFAESVFIDSDVLEAMRDCTSLAPLHNPHNIKGVEACEKLLPGIKQAGCFDTAFHQTMEPHAYLYALPYELYENNKIRRYGFHGTSHWFVAEQAAKFLGKDIKKLKIITCHCGNGSSITAIKYGKSVDTSMGFTPLEGLVMGTRCGDIDPAIIGYLQEYCGYGEKQVMEMLNNKSGVEGISQISNDLREIEEGYLKGDERCILTYKLMAHRMKKYIGAYAAVMNGVDAIVWTGGVGENDFTLRENTLKDMEYLGIVYDKNKNDNTIRGKSGDISGEGSKVKVLVLPTDEEFVIASETERIIKNLT
ncbi:MAG: acetate kinase [Candidatus Muirbacterium halophilum]|nr:acetate kinase [Candidatus Muirbacterium halophilum]MCK9477038.1 acetate kinase [Candidatus Muirbacterium halophilum]